jgi:hypothetical protein
LSDFQRLRQLAEDAAAENDVEADWFDESLIESDDPIHSSRKARRFIAAMTPQMAMRLILLAGRAPSSTQQGEGK